MTFTAPNVLTFLRIATVPLLVYLLTFTGPVPSAIAAGVFFLATITDYLDGYIARAYGSGTNLGKFLDPLADKLVVTAVLIMLAAMPRYPHVPAWMVVVLVSREILVTGLRAVSASRGRIVGAGFRQVQNGVAIDRAPRPPHQLHLLPRGFLCRWHVPAVDGDRGDGVVGYRLFHQAVGLMCRRRDRHLRIALRSD